MPSLYKNIPCDQPRYQVREKRRCIETFEFCTHTELKQCECLSYNNPTTYSNLSTLIDHVESVTSGVRTVSPKLSAATIVALSCIVLLAQGGRYTYWFSILYDPGESVCVFVKLIKLRKLCSPYTSYNCYWIGSCIIKLSSKYVRQLILVIHSSLEKNWNLWSSIFIKNTAAQY